MLLQRSILAFITCILLVPLYGCASNGTDRVYSDRFIQLPVKTGGDKTSRINIASQVVYDIEPDLKQRVASKFPTVTKRQLDSLSLKTGYDNLFIGTGPSPRVYIQINLTYLGSHDETWVPIIKFCAEEINSAIEKATLLSN